MQAEENAERRRLEVQHLTSLGRAESGVLQLSTFCAEGQWEIGKERNCYDGQRLRW